MDSQQFYLEEGFPFQGRRLEKLKAFLTQTDLSYDSQIEYTALFKTQDGQIAGCGSRHKNTLKCIAINPAFQGKGCLSLDYDPAFKKRCLRGNLPFVFVYKTPVPANVFRHGILLHYAD